MFFCPQVAKKIYINMIRYEKKLNNWLNFTFFMEIEQADMLLLVMVLVLDKWIELQLAKWVKNL